MQPTSERFWEEQRVDEDQYGALVEWNREEKLKCWGEKPVPVPL